MCGRQDLLPKASWHVMYRKPWSEPKWAIERPFSRWENAITREEAFRKIINWPSHGFVRLPN
jgi:uncharacterized protein YfaP (DUF2135 family)